MSPLHLLLLTLSLGPVLSANVIHSDDHRVPPPEPHIKFENELYPNNFLTLAQTTLKLYWDSYSSPNHPPVRAYQLERAELKLEPNIVDTTQSVEDGVDFEIVETDIGLLSYSGNSVQYLTIKGDTTLAGEYQLAFAYGQELTVQPHLDPQQNTVTPKIPVDATSAQLKAALESLENIQTVEVRRCDEWTTDSGIDGWMGECPYLSVGGYTYRIVFTATQPEALLPRTQQLQPLATTDLPLLTVYKNEISTAWSGTGPQISVQETTQHQVSNAVCQNIKVAPFTTNTQYPCSYTVQGLEPNKRYVFRLRVLTEDNLSTKTYSSAGPNSVIVRTPALLQPSRPLAPQLSAFSEDSITVVLQADPNDLNPFAPVPTIRHFEVQTEYENAPNSWYTFDSSATTSPNLHTPNPGVTSSSKSDLKADTPYRFRTRAVNDIGASVWSVPSKYFVTSSGVPDAPASPVLNSVDDSSVDLSWSPPAKDGGSAISKYEVQYRKSSSIHSTAETGWFELKEDVEFLASGPKKEVQTVTTKVDGGDTISSGSFWLSFRNERSGEIKYDADASQIKTALSSISTISDVVAHRYTPGDPRSTSSLRGSYTWRIEFMIEDDNILALDTHPTLGLEKHTLDGAFSGGPRVAFARLHTAVAASFLPTITTKVPKLDSFTRYDFRVRCKNGVGYSPYSSLLSAVRTTQTTSMYVYPNSRTAVSTYDHTMSVAAVGQNPAMVNDVDYVSYGSSTAGKGGEEKNSGENGLAVIIAYAEDRTEESRSVFYYSGNSQIYTVPELAGWKRTSSKTDRWIDVKLWGAGGGGGYGVDGGGRGTLAGTTILPSGTDYSKGGGGGFVQARFKVVPGESLTVVVGGGGVQTRATENRVGGNGGFNGGGGGGHGVDGAGGGGGGGMTSLLRGATVLAVAGGGGGGGATDYCCASGGGGGGTVAETGKFPGPNTPLDTTNDDAAAANVRNDFSADDYGSLGPDTAGSDPRDTSGMPPHHEHIDRGFAPNASYGILATGGSGGDVSNSLAGLPGTSGNYKVFMGELNYLTNGPEGNVPLIQMTDNSVSMVALPGQQFVGGRGADGKEGGGGGGGGFYGGGGGGSGVDAAGGGGGCGYIDYTAVYAPDPKDRSAEGPDAPSQPTFYNLKHDSFSVQWDRPVNGTSVHMNDVRAYDIEYIQGRSGAGAESDECSDEYTRYQQLKIGVDEVVDKITVRNLEENTKYCVRILAVSVRGLSEASPVLEVVTESSPVNSWEVVAARRDKVLASGRGDASGVMDRPHVHPDVETRGGSKGVNPDRTFAGPSENIGVVPSPRRGSTLNKLPNGDVYLFGGMTEGYKCDDAGVTDTQDQGDVSGGIDVERCRKEAGVNNDLWKFDVSTGMWSVVFENDDSAGAVGPGAREGHTANVMEDGTILIFGGKTLQAGDFTGSNKTNVHLGDMWELDMTDPTSHTVVGSGSGHPAASLPQTLKEGVMEYFSVNASLSEATVGGNGDFEGELCIDSVAVEISLTHNCVKDLQINLLGPGPRTGDKNYHPESRADRAQIFNYFSGARGCGTEVEIDGTTFSDDGQYSINGEFMSAPWSGETVRPIDSLNDKFAGSVANGEWTLEVYDPEVDGTVGSLTDWNLKFVMSPCKAKAVWTEKTTRVCAESIFEEGSGGGVVYRGCVGSDTAIVGGSPSASAGPSPRFQHSTVQIKNILYVMGGSNGNLLDDIWRYDKSAATWVQLKGAVEPPHVFGRSLSLTPWGILAFGGLNKDGEWTLEGRVWHYNMALRVWNVLGSTQEESGGVADVQPLAWRASGLKKDVAYPEVFENAPQPHYLSSTVMVGLERGDDAEREGLVLGAGMEPQIILFGGDYGIARNKYSNDMRVLKLRNLGAEENDDIVELEREETCGWRLQSGSTADSFWTATCGSGGNTGSANDCEVQEILLRAWCEKEYQDIGNLM
ncbi:hypothetical protein TrST_g11438 [Triparma strigata]|uniref:Fibronectin type-III domain-containing protein n=1 Tax=Triparma strigata TaxID=1606541 RepID=A0A9W7ADT4_9STRA|nr:hypothetical protein TrST_g11438 [Triparma strigata]